MEEIWARIDAWLKVNAPKVFETLQPGASESQIQAIEMALAIQFPEDFKDSYRIHNGQLLSEHWWGLIPEAQQLFSLEYIQGDWQGKKEWLDEGLFSSDSETDKALGIRSDRWNAKWIPLTFDGDGNSYCFDLDPADEGTVGQIITWYHDDSYQELLTPSFRSWLEDYAAKLESGEYVFSEKYPGFQGIVRLELLEYFKQRDLEQEREKSSPPPRSYPLAETVVTAKSVTIGVYDGWQQPISRDAPPKDKDEIMISLNGEPILPNILIDSIEQFYTVELSPGVNTITVTLVRASPKRASMSYVTIDRSLIYAGKTEHGFGFSESMRSASFTMSYLPD